jgi:hypothetical protein
MSYPILLSSSISLYLSLSLSQWAAACTLARMARRGDERWAAAGWRSECTAARGEVEGMGEGEVGVHGGHGG